MVNPVAAALVVALAAAPPDVRPPPDAGARELHVDLVRDGAIAAGTIAASTLVSAFRSDLAPASCRWCQPNRFDVWARDQLLWRDPGAARTASNLAIVIVPAGVAGALALSGLDGTPRRMLEDFVLVAEAFGVTMLGDQVPKLAVARLRPYALYGTAITGSSEDRVSFWSAHSALAFSAATSAGTVARLRGYSSWPWILGLGVAGATATAWFRVAADRHWTTDVLAGAAWGTAVGVAVPLLHLRREPRATIVPSGRGVVVVVPL